MRRLYFSFRGSHQGSLVKLIPVGLTDVISWNPGFRNLAEGKKVTIFWISSFSGPIAYISCSFFCTLEWKKGTCEILQLCERIRSKKIRYTVNRYSRRLGESENMEDYKSVTNCLLGWLLHLRR